MLAAGRACIRSARRLRPPAREFCAGAPADEGTDGKLTAGKPSPLATRNVCVCVCQRLRARVCRLSCGESVPLLCSHETGGPSLICLSATRHPPRRLHPPLRTLFFFSLPSVFFAALFLPCFGSLASRLFPPPLRLPPAPCAAPSDKTPFFPPLFPPPSSHPPLSPMYKYRPSSLSYL